jgi:hypothetical protein
MHVCFVMDMVGAWVIEQLPPRYRRTAQIGRMTEKASDLVICTQLT